MNTRDLKVFFIYALSKGILTIATIFALYILNSKPVFLIILRTDLILEYILLCYFFSLNIRQSLISSILKISIIPFVVYCVIDLFTHDRGVFSNVPTLVEQIVFMSVIIFMFFEKMKLNFEVPVYQTVNFWVLVGLFVYFSGAFFYILLAENYYRVNERIRWELLFISSFVNIAKNLILGLAISVKEPEGFQDEYDFNIPLEMDLDSFKTSTNLN